MARKDNEALLKEIRENFDYARAYWREVRKEAETDVLYATRGPWTQDERDARAGRPTLTLDELGQYLNQLENQARQNPRAVKVNPEGDGADDQSALMRAGIIRGIEYKCKAQQAYVGAFGNAVRRSYGYAKLTTDYEAGSFNRVLKVSAIPNPDVIYLDPDFKEADASDCGWSFEIERMREKQFAKRWPRAEVRSFTPEDMAIAPAWITSGDDGKHIQVASYCRREMGSKKLALMEDGSTVDLGSKDYEGVELISLKTIDGEPAQALLMPDGSTRRVVDTRDDDDPKVVQYITNGIEILEKQRLDFKEVNVIPCFGREQWVTQGGIAKREYISLTRMARDAYKLYCYARSAQCERAGMDPKTPYEGFEGQFNTNTDFAKLASNPVGYVEFAAKTEATGEVILPLPQKNFSEPAIQQMEILAEAARRAIQAAMGGSPLPTAAQRSNEKSGVALARIEQSSDEGNFHFLDNYNRFLERIGRMMDGALDIVYDTPNRQVPFRDENEEHSTLTINPHDEQGQPTEGFHVGSGDHGVTISTGPSNQSQREAADDFAADLLKTPELLGPTPNKVVALIVKLRNLGPIGDRIADIIAPEQEGPPPIPPAVQQHMAESDQMVQKLTQEVELLKAGLEIKKYTVDEQEKTKRVLGLAQINSEEAQVQLEQELGVLHKQADRGSEVIQQNAGHVHEANMAASGQGHEAAMQQQSQDHAAAQSDADRQQAQELAAQSAAQKGGNK